jgi:hypothetical protein
MSFYDKLLDRGRPHPRHHQEAATNRVLCAWMVYRDSLESTIKPARLISGAGRGTKSG